MRHLNKWYCYICALSALLIWENCAQVIDIELPDEEPKLVVISNFSVDDLLKANISLSRPIYADSLPVPPITLNVSILDSNGATVGVLRRPDHENQEYWVINKEAELGYNQPYTIIAYGDDIDTIVSTSYIPKPVILNKTLIRREEIEPDKPLDSTMNLKVVPIKIRVKNIPESNRYFGFILRSFIAIKGGGEIEKRCNFRTDGHTFYALHETPEGVLVVNQSYWNNGDTEILLEALVPYHKDNETPQVIQVEWRTLSPDYYKYHLSLSRQGAPGFPLNESDAIYNNIKGGYGNFSGYSTFIEDVIIDF